MNKYKLTPSPVSIQIDYGRRLANPLFPVLLLSFGRALFICAPENLQKILRFLKYSGVREKNIDSKRAIHRSVEKLSQAGQKNNKVLV